MFEYFVIDKAGDEFGNHRIEIFYSFKEAALYCHKLNMECGDKFRYVVRKGSKVY